MATAEISQSGNLTAIKVFASVDEQSASGNYRTVYLNVWAEPQDGYTGARDADWEFNAVDAYGDLIELSSSSNTIITDKMSIYSGTITLYVEHGETSAYPSISFSAEYYSPSNKAYRSVTGEIIEIYGLSIVADTLISSAKDIYFGDSCQITWTPSSSDFYYKLTFSLGKDSHTTSIIRPNDTRPYTYSGFSIPLDWASNIPNNISTTARVSLTQYERSNGTGVIGTPSFATFTVTLRDDVVPSIKTCSTSIVNTSGTIVDTWGIAMAGYSRINISATSSGVYGSTISRYNITGGYVISASPTSDGSLNYTGGVISTSGNKQFNITCTDSRGRTSNIFESDEISIRPYIQPRIKKLSVSKETNGTPGISDDVMVVTATWEYDPIYVGTSGVPYNSVNAELYYREGVDSDWTLYSNGIQNGRPYQLSNLKLNESSSYNFKLTITDSIGNKSEKESFSSARAVLMDFQAGGKGLGIGKICQIDNSEKDAGSLEVSMDSYFWRNMQLLGEAALIISSNMYGTEDPDDKFAGTTVLPGQIYFKKVGG